jgi:2-polyprenyl-3-methyl-5-hydroxy-6-metoxy-1,4-benzoquinol methylase
MHYPASQLATFPFSLSSELPADEVRRLQEELNRLVSEAPYGWAHTLDPGADSAWMGCSGTTISELQGSLDEWQWWPASLEGARVADVGCFSGALSLMMSARGATEVVAVDEIQQHLAQCEWLAADRESRTT